MAIALDANVANQSSSGVSSITISHTCTGSNLMLTVGVYDQSIGDNTTGVTYNSVALTKAGSLNLTGDAGTFLYLWYLIGPSTGANNVVISRSSSANSLVGDTASWTGVEQNTSHIVTTTSIEPSSATNTTTLTTTADNSICVLSNRNGCAGTTASTGTLKLGTGNASAIFYSSAAVTPAGSTSLVVTSSACANAFGSVMMSMAPSGGAAATVVPTPTLLMLNVG